MDRLISSKLNAFEQRMESTQRNLSQSQILTISLLELELMFMKHYAPNRCVYIKAAKLRTGVGSAEMSHLQNCSLKIYLKRALGGRVGGGGGQDGCERRIKVFVNI